jgi:hypothetical protein
MLEFMAKLERLREFWHEVDFEKEMFYTFLSF